MNRKWTVLHMLIALGAMAGAGVAPAPAAPGDYDFTGVYRIGDTWRFNLLDRASGRQAWVGLLGRIGDARVISYDPATDTVRLDVRGIIREIPLRGLSEPAGSLAAGGRETAEAGAGSTVDAGPTAYPRAAAMIPAAATAAGAHEVTQEDPALPAGIGITGTAAIPAMPDMEGAVAGADPRVLAARLAQSR